MATSRTREDLLSIARASPAAVARHDKQAWLDLFARNAVVEDPVGSAPHPRPALERFYETFIAPNQIVFEVNHDVVSGSTVARDVDIHITSPAGVVAVVPAYILYEVAEENGVLRIARLSAYWELAAMMRRVMRQGLAALRMSADLAVRMLREQGGAGMLGYARGFAGVGRYGKEVLRKLTDKIQCKKPADDLARLFVPAPVGVELPAPGAAMTPRAFVERGVLLSTSDPVSAGFSTAFRFLIEEDGVTRRGIGVLDFDPTRFEIVRARFFYDAPPAL